MNRTIIDLLVVAITEGFAAALKYLQSKSQPEPPPGP